jgi:hypothetical protein
LQAQAFGEMAGTQAIEGVELRKVQAVGLVAKCAVEVAGEVSADARRVVEHEPASAGLVADLHEAAGVALRQRLAAFNQRLG